MSFVARNSQAAPQARSSYMLVDGYVDAPDAKLSEYRPGLDLPILRAPACRSAGRSWDQNAARMRGVLCWIRPAYRLQCMRTVTVSLRAWAPHDLAASCCGPNPTP